MIRLTMSALLMVSLAALAQQAANESPASRQQILKLFEVMHIRQQMRTMMAGVLKQQASLVRESIKQRYPQVTAEDLTQMDEFMLESMKGIPVDGMLDDMIPVYQKHLSQPDVEAMIRFYSSPTGQKLMQEMPAMTSEGIEAAYPRMQRQMEKIMQRVEERMKQKAQPRKNGAPKTPSPTGHDATSSTWLVGDNRAAYV